MVAAGYNIMETEGYSYQVILAVLLMVLYLFAMGTLWRHNRTAMALFLVTGPVFFLYWKDGFVRHDLVLWGAHELMFFTAAVFIFGIHYFLAGTLFPRVQKLFMGGALVCWFYICVPAFIIGATSGAPGFQIYRFFGYASPARHHSVKEEISSQLRTSYDFPATFVAHLAVVPTLILPWDLVLAPAYQVPLVLPPVPQNYSVYTSYLDHVQAAWLNKRQPSQILYNYIAMEGRYPLFEGPEFSYDILRQYAVVDHTDSYAVLQRKTAIEPPIVWKDKTQAGHFDREVVLPQADANHYVLLKVKMRRSILGELFGFVYKTTSPQIVFHLKDGTSRSHRFVDATGEDGLLVSHCVENMDQYVRLNKMDWAPNVQSISFMIDGSSRWQFVDDFPLQFGTSVIAP